MRHHVISGFPQRCCCGEDIVIHFRCLLAGIVQLLWTTICLCTFWVFLCNKHMFWLKLNHLFNHFDAGWRVSTYLNWTKSKQIKKSKIWLRNIFKRWKSTFKVTLKPLYNLGVSVAITLALAGGRGGGGGLQRNDVIKTSQMHFIWLQLGYFYFTSRIPVSIVTIILSVATEVRNTKKKSQTDWLLTI